ncbi:DUF1349 domain-containing protein [Kibdelosporangium aridum]|uniref:DUF1349 domain-containing protein n=1 Tax=Kibdelosporangium aridum TaxID=2030 RepID=A0A428ZCF9_KIBAR|nr:DUF1349 domain-containing protein [Kibdelosporangium aridum]RSM85726.1 DUF1349 domain-containing protein [Kibdelosporangium aridum]
MAVTHTVPPIPFELAASHGSSWTINPDGSVSTVALPHSDIFVDPAQGTTGNAESMLNAATLLGTPPPGDFQLSARVTVDFTSTFDAGVLLLWFDERHWAKLCFEFSPSGDPMVVSVVNRDVADDANAFIVDGNTVWLRVSRIAHTYAYHASLDGQTWQMIRYFVLGNPSDAATIGFEAQSPTGDGCTVTFHDVRFVQETLPGLRDGS